MDYTGITFGLGALVSIVSGIGSALAFYFRLKNRLDLLAADLNNVKKDFAEFKIMINGRVDNVKSDVNENRDRSEKHVTEIKTMIMDMKIEIIKEIHGKE